MKRIRYTKYVPDPAGEMSMEDLLSALSDYLLQSGFQNDNFLRAAGGRADAGRFAARHRTGATNSDMFDEEMRDVCSRCRWRADSRNSIEKLIQRMEQEDYIPSMSRPILANRRGGRPGWRDGTAGEIRDHRQESRLSWFQGVA